MANEKTSRPLILEETSLLQTFNGENGFSKMRQKAYELWKKCPVPTTRDEYWKYTRLAPILNKSYNATTSEYRFNTDFVRDIDAYNLVFINGIFSASDSNVINEPDFILTDLKSLKENNAKMLSDLLKSNKNEDDYFSLLNSAFHQNGPFIFVGKNKKIHKPIRVLHISSGTDRLVNVKGLIRTEKGSSVTVVESWDSDDSKDNLINTRVDFSLDENSSVELIKIQSIDTTNSLISQEFVEQNRDSRFASTAISMDGKMIRNNVNVSLNGEGSESHLNGLYMLKGEEHVDNHTKVIHAVPNCESNELYKGILNDKSKGVFNGKVIVSRDAQKTNAFQYNGNILLTDEAQVYSKPELEIYADDVKCSHGSTTGQLDDEALFYLESRGINRDKARNLLLKAFATEVLEKISLPKLRERIEQYISERYKTDDYA